MKRLIIPIEKDTQISIGDILMDPDGVQRPVMLKSKKKVKGKIIQFYLLGHKNTYRLGKWKSHESLIALGDKLIYGNTIFRKYEPKIDT